MRNNDAALLALYDAFFTSAEVTVLEVSPAVIEKATALRAALKVKTPDAIHLASAIVTGVDAFLTGDSTLAPLLRGPCRSVLTPRSSS
jgi:predicted nucleic acid-binding protein